MEDDQWNLEPSNTPRLGDTAYCEVYKINYSKIW